MIHKFLLNFVTMSYVLLLLSLVFIIPIYTILKFFGPPGAFLCLLYVAGVVAGIATVKGEKQKNDNKDK